MLTAARWRKRCWSGAAFNGGGAGVNQINKVGATLESIARNRIVSYGQAWDGAIYSLFRVIPEREFTGK